MEKQSRIQKGMEWYCLSLEKLLLNNVGPMDRMKWGELLKAEKVELQTPSTGLSLKVILNYL